MKTIKTQAVITTVSSRQDRSIRFSTETPEFTDEQFTEFRALQGNNVVLTITPIDETPDDVMEVTEEMDAKPRSVRLRNSLYALWNAKFRDKYNTFDDFYRIKMDTLIEDVQRKIED